MMPSKRFEKRTHTPKYKNSDEGRAFRAFLDHSKSIVAMRELCKDVKDTADAKYETRSLKVKGTVIVSRTWLK